MPSNVPLFGLFFTVNEWLHTMIVKTVGFDEIDNVEFVNLILASVAYPEEKPLAQLLWRAVVKLEIEVVFKFADLSSSVQVATFKP